MDGNVAAKNIFLYLVIVFKTILHSSSSMDLLYVCLDHPQRVSGGFIVVQNLVGLGAVVSIICQL